MKVSPPTGVGHGTTKKKEKKFFFPRGEGKADGVGSGVVSPEKQEGKTDGIKKRKV